MAYVYVWSEMKRRCTDPTHHAYKNYGARGIKVCKRWLDFETFAADMWPKPSGRSIDRKDNDGDYEPSNCRWVTLRQQANNRRDNVRIFFDGKNLTLSQWARRLNVRKQVIRHRLEQGWSPRRIIMTPLRAAPVKSSRKEKRIVLELHARGLSQTEIAKEIGRSQPAIGRWLRRWLRA